jgi:hypothetical protein
MSKAKKRRTRRVDPKQIRFEKLMSALAASFPISLERLYAAYCRKRIDPIDAIGVLKKEAPVKRKK